MFKFLKKNNTSQIKGTNNSKDTMSMIERANTFMEESNAVKKQSRAFHISEKESSKSNQTAIDDAFAFIEAKRKGVEYKKSTYVDEFSADNYDLSFDTACNQMGLTTELSEELRLVYLFAGKANMLICDYKDLKGMCQYLINSPEDIATYGLVKSNLNAILRKAIIAESKWKHTVSNDTTHIGLANGEQFEKYCATLLKSNGYKNVEITVASGDHGVDILAEKDMISYAIQCKYYSSPVGNSAIQQAFSGKKYYERDIAVVMTNSIFTKQAIEDAKALGVKLWDKSVIDSLEKQMSQ